MKKEAAGTLAVKVFMTKELKNTAAEIVLETHTPAATLNPGRVHQRGKPGIGYRDVAGAKPFFDMFMEPASFFFPHTKWRFPRENVLR